MNTSRATPEAHVTDASDATAANGNGAARPAVQTLLDAALRVGISNETTTSPKRQGPSDLDRFLASESAAEALKVWFMDNVPTDRDALARPLGRALARIDALISEQLNAVLHHPVFQKLESAWRGVAMLVNQADELGDETSKIRVFPARWEEIWADFDSVLEFDQSVLFRQIYEKEFGTAGGHPLGMLIADYDINPKRKRPDDVAMVESLSQVAAGAFCPTVLNASPAMFGIDDFADLERHSNVDSVFDNLKYLKWNRLRDSEDSRFVGLTLPRTLMRLPYEGNDTVGASFQFQEEVSAPDGSGYLWGGAGYALGAVVLRAYADCQWFADIRGVDRGYESSGLVTHLPAYDFGTDARNVAPRISTDVVITDQLEKRLCELGFISLCTCHDTPYSAFYSTPSIQKPKGYSQADASVNARISAMLHYMLCVGRFAHYLKAYGRDMVGNNKSPRDIESTLRDWLAKYTTGDDEASPEKKAKYPLRSFDVRILPKPAEPGKYDAMIKLMPHYQFDDAQANIELRTELAAGDRN